MRKKSFDAEQRDPNELERSILMAQRVKRAADSPEIGPKDRTFSPLKERAGDLKKRDSSNALALRP